MINVGRITKFKLDTSKKTDWKLSILISLMSFFHLLLDRSQSKLRTIELNALKRQPLSNRHSFSKK